MNAEQKVEIFRKELGYINDNTIKEVVTEILGELPDYFFTVAASSTGKYHPKMSLGEGGLVRHTKAAVQIAMDLIKLEMFKPLETYFDYLIGCLILHDGLKHGNPQEQYTRADHPVVMSEFIKSFEVDGDPLKTQILGILAGGVLTHMGQWNSDYKTNRILMPKPVTKFQSLVHLCDYLASRKYIEMEF